MRVSGLGIRVYALRETPSAEAARRYYQVFRSFWGVDGRESPRALNTRQVLSIILNRH